MYADLHTHTRASDGALMPQQLVDAAANCDIGLLAITDHDTIAGYEQITVVPESLHLVGGIELSTSWQGIGIHIVGLNIDLASDAILDAIACQGQARRQRAEKIAAVLERFGLECPLQGAQGLASDGNVGRPHFARYMVDSGFVRSESEAFRKYLGAGKPGDIKNCWASLEAVIDWIRSSSGTAVLAHPAKYGLTRSRLHNLVAAFASAGGQALEVVSGSQLPAQARDFANLAITHGLSMSCGSDFHQPGQPWARLGHFGALPAGMRAVWENW